MAGGEFEESVLVHQVPVFGSGGPDLAALASLHDLFGQQVTRMAIGVRPGEPGHHALEVVPGHRQREVLVGLASDQSDLLGGERPVELPAEGADPGVHVAIERLVALALPHDDLAHELADPLLTGLSSTACPHVG